MESQEVLEGSALDSSVGTSSGDGLELEQVGSHVKVSDNLNVDFLEDFDSYLEDINGRLMISRMVSDSIIKGITNAVEQEAAEKAAEKELELVSLRQSLNFLHVGRDETEPSLSLVIHHEPENLDFFGYLSFPDACVKHDKMREALHILRKATRDQFETLKKEIKGARGCYSLRRVCSGSELLGLGGILKEKEPESWVGVDRTVNSLEMTMNTICTQVDDMLQLCKTSLCEWQHEQDLKGELEAIVMQSSIRCLQEEFEEKLWDRNSCLYGSQSVNCLEKLNEISGLRKDLEAFLKSLPNPESGHLLSQGSCDIDNSHGSLTSLWEVNGKGDESKTGVPEHFDAAQLNHMSNEELVNYFNTTIMKIKREHESAMQGLTEKYISLKGKYYNERRSGLPLTKDKDFDILRKKIPKIILKLDDILVESEKSLALSDDADSLGCLKDRLDTLLAENRQLRDSLTDKKNEVNCLSSQVSGASEKMLQHSLVEVNLQNLIGNLNSSMADARIEASVIEEVYKCVIGDLSGQIKCISEESELELTLMQEIYEVILREASVGAKTSSTCEIEDVCMESLIRQGLCETIFIETLKDAERKFLDLFREYLIANQNRVSLEIKAKEIEANLRMEVEEKERLRQEGHLLAKLMEEKEKLEKEVSAALTKEREQTEVDKMEINSLNRKLETTMKELKEADELRHMIVALTQEKQSCFALFEAKGKEHKMQMEAVVALVDGLSKRLADFECRVAGNMEKNNMRLENSRSQLSSLIKVANTLKRTGFLYKQRLEKRSSDLQMAEAEVDLLGDEVDTLLSLLGKIYVALDHYSPVLQHYPGVIEILKLIRRELSGESIKP